MALDNTITVSGSLGRDVELRYTTSGRAVASVGLAVSRRWQQNGEWQEETTWIDVTCWADLAEHFAASCSKGDRVMVTGRLEQRSWDDKEGNKRYSFQIVADDIGPSLKWAECTIERIRRDDSSSSGSSGNRGTSDTLDPEEPFVRQAVERDL